MKSSSSTRRPPVIEFSSSRQPARTTQNAAPEVAGRRGVEFALVAKCVECAEAQAEIECGASCRRSRRGAIPGKRVCQARGRGLTIGPPHRSTKEGSQRETAQTPMTAPKLLTAVATVLTGPRSSKQSNYANIIA